jgi:DNA-binding winged helix-turn-helix (wHTH) protein
MPNSQFKLNSWLISPQKNTISNSSISQNLDNKSMQVLLYLRQHAGQKVTKKQILENVWKEKKVSDDILSVAVSNIRKAFGDNARSPTYIKRYLA